MSLFKRREYSLELADGTRQHAFQHASPEVAATKAAEIASAHGVTHWKLWRDPHATWTCSITHAGTRHVIDTHFTDLVNARKFEVQYRRALADDRLADLKRINLRQPSTDLTVGQLLPHWRGFASARGITESARRGYENALRVIWQRSTGQMEGFESVSLSTYTPTLVYRFKEAVISAAGGDAEQSAGRVQQLRRSANSVLQQAKGLFSRRALEHYRLVAKLKLPESLADFMASPGFPDTTKEEYHLPPDQVVAATFEALEKDRLTHRNRYIALWLAIGFGLRKSEIAAVRAGWFQRVGDTVQLELRATVVPGKVREEKESTKNNQIWPRIDVSNGAWEKLAPLIAELKPDDYLIQSPTATARVEGVFRDISVWMRELGWGTQKTFHEFRAFGGCQVAMRDGIRPKSSIAVSAWHEDNPAFLDFAPSI